MYSPSPKAANSFQQRMKALTLSIGGDVPKVMNGKRAQVMLSIKAGVPFVPGIHRCPLRRWVRLQQQKAENVFQNDTEELPTNYGGNVVRGMSGRQHLTTSNMGINGAQFVRELSHEVG